MKTVGVSAVLSCAFLFVSGCAESSLESQVESAFKKIVLLQLKNPSSAEFHMGGVKRVTLPNIRTLGSGGGGYFVCAVVRATNGFGGVVPQGFQGFFNDSGSPIYVGTLEDTPWGSTSEEIRESKRWISENLPSG